MKCYLSALEGNKCFGGTVGEELGIHTAWGGKMLGKVFTDKVIFEFDLEERVGF